MKNIFKLLVLIIGMSFALQFNQPLFGQANELTDIGQNINENASGYSGYSAGAVVLIAFICLLMGGCFAIAFFLTVAQKETLPVLAKIEHVFNFFRHARHARNKLVRFFSPPSTGTTEAMGSE